MNENLRMDVCAITETAPLRWNLNEEMSSLPGKDWLFITRQHSQSQLQTVLQFTVKQVNLSLCLTSRDKYCRFLGQQSKQRQPRQEVADYTLNIPSNWEEELPQLECPQNLRSKGCCHNTTLTWWNGF